MACNYQKKVPGDCHIACIREFDEVEYTLEFSKVLRNLPGHAGSFPYLFSAGFVCYACPAKDEQRDETKIKELDPLISILAMLR